ncbi:MULTISPECIES: amidohydrolase [unclassified Enterococcus]|uniref:amidohydrolase n=1 Tax=unclassified Enterococcus TaxID=2608891 RepID=UPI00155182DD|nr:MULTISPECIES: amidohydrolase [unclassified Enterococcus]MBS7576764.1 amidohydrolase [Enterococcus sp. MMGLQ5-2]MBS7583749.1 amidohydrolase [Enterococcus sp. MMGLQ5-1]NPD11610.1 amidohydrolase [Enterococcus sp. MMGLQ5-1]NPD36601.1 amidohydrolase [Enterococcus sp. MMGLQ5-2]
MENILLIKSSSIFTGESNLFQSGLIMVVDGIINGIYSDEETIPKVILKQSKLLDIGARTVCAGFIDAHLHVFMSALVHGGKIHLITGKSEMDCVKQLRKRFEIARLPKDDWLISKGWYSPDWKSNQLPTKASLDTYFPNRPVMMISADLHTIWLNSCGLERLNLDDSTLLSDSVVKSEITKCETGVILEGLAMSCMSQIFQEAVPDKAKYYEHFFRQQLSMGITSVCDLALLADETAQQIDDQIYPEVYSELEKSGRLSVRAHLFPMMLDNFTRIKEWRFQYQSDFLRIAGGKHFFDGVISTHTAYMKSSYEHSNSVGKTTISPTDLQKKIDLASKNQLPLRIHTIGDAAISTAIDYFSLAAKRYGQLKTGYHCLEHLEIIDPMDIPRLKAAGLIASVQPSHCLMDYETVDQDIGFERSQKMWPFNDFLKEEVPIAFGTDSPVVVDVTPLDNLYFAMSRQTKVSQPEGGWIPDQKISLTSALAAQTKAASQACSFSEKIGTITKGKFADLVVLSTNLENINAEELLKIEVDYTIVNGEIKYKKS